MVKSTPVRPLPGSTRASSWLRSFNATLTALSLAGALALIGCSTAKTHIDTGAVAGRTFVFMNTGKKATPAYADNRDKAHAMIQAAITKNLAAKGIKSTPGDADLMVAYLLIVGNNADTTSLNDYFGYGDDATALVDKVHREQAVKGKERFYFESGTLVIDIVDTKTSQVRHRATIQAPVLRDLAPEARAERIQSLVDQALSKLRLAP